MTVTAGPISSWSLVVLVGWVLIVAFVWLLLLAHGRRSPG